MRPAPSESCGDKGDVHCSQDEASQRRLTGAPVTSNTGKADASWQDRVLSQEVGVLITRPLLSTPTNGARDVKGPPRPCGNVIQTQPEEVTVSEIQFHPAFLTKLTFALDKVLWKR